MMTEPKRIILIRHGQSAGNADEGVYCSTPDALIELTAHGRAEALHIGQRLRTSGLATPKVYCSPFRRAKQTCEELLRGLGVSPEEYVEEPRLREQDYGPMRRSDENLELREQRKINGRFFYRFPQGESCADVYDRVSHFLDSFHREMIRDGLPETVIIVSHNTASKCFLFRWFKWSVWNFDAFPDIPNCKPVEIIRTPDGDSIAKGSFVDDLLAAYPDLSGRLEDKLRREVG